MHELSGGLHKILGERLLGVYLGGSAAMDDFQDASSDLDFLVVTRGPLSMEDALAVKLLHKALLKRCPYAARLEGDYAPLEVLIPEGTSEPVPGCEGGKFLPKVGEIVLSADNISNMYTHGINFYGPPAGELLPAVTSDQVRAAVRMMLTQPLEPCDTALEAASTLLSLVRSACALETGRPTTKAEGAAWGLANLDPKWHTAIGRALEVRCGTALPGDLELLKAALPEVQQAILSCAAH
jgi:streptomycin 3"-adenylyltransferase